MPLGLITSEWINLAVAAGTLALAGATWWMARGTAALAQISKVQHEATVTPILRVVRIGQPDQADVMTVNQDSENEALVVSIENCGPTTAEVERCSLIPGGPGAISDPDELFSPALEPGSTRDFDFYPTSTDKERHRQGEHVALRVIYRAVSSGGRYRATEHLKCEQTPEGTQWRILGSEAPRILG
jgi:hypothetical protein